MPSLIVVLFFTVGFCPPLIKGIAEHPIFLMIAFDGFSHEYLARNLTPIFQEVARNGTSAEYMKNQFPTITYPNFHSISTGMYTETHGVLGNSVFSEEMECLKNEYKLFHYNEEIIPIWNLNELSGSNRYSGTMMWPGSEFTYQNKTATFTQSSNFTIEWESRVHTVIDWIKNDKTPANLILMYFEQPDEVAHHYGPQSSQLDDQLKRINSIVQYLLQELETSGLRNFVNILFLADHGAVPVSSNTTLNMTDFVDRSKYMLCGSTPGLQIQPYSGYENEIYINLTRAEKLTNGFKVYKKEKLPNRWHFKNNRRQVDIYVNAELKYSIEDTGYKGDHGYDNKFEEMYPFFIAQGPLIKQNFVLRPFENVDLYPMLSYILDLTPPPAHVKPNGTIEILLPMLTENHKNINRI